MAPTDGCPYNEVRPYDFRSSRAPRPHRGRIPERSARGRGLGGGEEPEGGGPSASGPAVDLTKRGTIEVWQGKDTSGNFPKLIAQFNDAAPEREGHLQGAAGQTLTSSGSRWSRTPRSRTRRWPCSAWTWCGRRSSRPRATSIGAAEATSSRPTSSCRRPWTARRTSTSCTPTRATSDGGLLFYRKDLLDKYSLQPPTTFDEMKAACDTIRGGENDDKLECFAGQYNKYEGLTVNFDEAVHGAGGVIVGDDGKPNVATPEATKGLQTLVDWFKDGYIPKGAITWTGGAGPAGVPERHADLPPQLGLRLQAGGQDGRLVQDRRQVRRGAAAGHHRSGRLQPGRRTTTPSRRTPRTRAPRPSSSSSCPRRRSQKANTLATSDTPALASLYTDADMVKKYPYMPDPAQVDRDRQAASEGGRVR